MHYIGSARRTLVMGRLRILSALTVGLLLGLVVITIMGGGAFGAIVGLRLQAEKMTESSSSISVQSDPDGSGPAGSNLRWASGAGVSARASQSINVPTGSTVNQIQLFSRQASANTAVFAIYVDGTAAANRVGTFRPPAGSTWRTVTVNLTTAIGQGRHTIYIGPNATFSNNAYIDWFELHNTAPPQEHPCDTGEFLAEYRNGTGFAGDPTLSRCEARIDHDWASDAPDTAVNADGFTVRWVGRHTFEQGDYLFSATSDDGIRVWVDDRLLIDRWRDQSATTDQATSSMSAGDHEVRVEYYENTGLAEARVSWQKAAAPPPPTPSGCSGTYSAPTTITEGGTYTGCWDSNDRNVAAITIATSSPVTIADSTVKGPGHLIRASVDGTHVTVRDSEGYGENPNVSGVAKGRFFVASNVGSVTLANNYLEGTGGINVVSKRADSPYGAVKILRNKVLNIDGRRSNGVGGYQASGVITQFVQLNAVRECAGCEIAYNEVINRPGASHVEDVISTWLSSGTPSNPMTFHDNYIDGAFPAGGRSAGYSGGGIMVGDGGLGAITAVPHDVVAHNNVVTDTVNYGIAVAGGHNLTIRNNRIIGDNDGYSAANVGKYIWNLEGGANFYNNQAYSNVVGWKRADGSRNDWWLPNCSVNCSGNTNYAGDINQATEDNERQTWLNRTAALGVTVGPR